MILVFETLVDSEMLLEKPSIFTWFRVVCITGKYFKEQIGISANVSVLNRLELMTIKTPSSFINRLASIKQADFSAPIFWFDYDL